ncbi:MAG: SAF domain protein [Syntrophorhabdus sp. PtaU1.Bin153]|nr:MAG: SAF domain protein [Syntrophorhabdus sp. PtaU1.Bin153]
MTNKGPVVILGIGILIALVVSIVSYKVLRNKAQKQVQIQETVNVAVAAVDMAWGTVLNKQMIKTAPYLRKSLPNGYHTSAADLEGRVLVYPVKSDEPIFESSLAPTQIKTGGMAAVVQPNKRAMAVKVDKVVGVSGFVFPGNRVDVLVTLPERGENKTAITKIVLENILVLATGPEVEKTGKQEKPATVDVITLEVTPEEGEKLGLAATEGKLQLALRNFSDSAEVKTKGTTIPVLLSSYGSARELKPSGFKSAPARSAPARQPLTVELIQGSKVSSVKFEKGE